MKSPRSQRKPFENLILLIQNYGIKFEVYVDKSSLKCHSADELKNQLIVQISR